MAAVEVAKVLSEALKEIEAKKARDAEEHTKAVAVKAVELYNEFTRCAITAAREGLVGIDIVPAGVPSDLRPATKRCSLWSLPYDKKVTEDRTWFNCDRRTTKLALPEALAGMLIRLKHEGYTFKTKTLTHIDHGYNTMYVTSVEVVNVRWDKVKPRGPEPSAPLKSVET